MSDLLTTTHRVLLRRFALAMAVVLIGSSALFLLSGVFQWENVLRIGTPETPVHANAATCSLILGVSLLAFELGLRRAALLSLVAGALALISSLQPWTGFSFNVDELLLRDHSATDAGAVLPLHPVAGLCYILASLTLASMAAPKPPRALTVALALAGSILGSIGVSTLTGYALDLPVVYRWGAAHGLPPGTAALLVALSLALLALAWREHQGELPGAPTWVPMPVVVGSATLTVLLWLGLREAEQISLGSSIQSSVRNYAAAIGRELERQADGAERLAQRWSRSSDGGEQEWSRDVRSLRDEAMGIDAISRLDDQGRTTWVDVVSGDEWVTGFDHRRDSARRQALEHARDYARPEFSGSLRRTSGLTGYAVYAPILSQNHPSGAVCLDISYRRLFSSIERALKLSDHFRIEVAVAGEAVYGSGPADERASEFQIEEVFDVADRRVRVSLSPTVDFMRQNRRYLPELALGTGTGITLLLGLSVHLARTARSGLRSARLSNLRLVSENEERRRVEERLKVSDERLRLALDSTQIGIFEWNLPGNQLYYSPGVWNMLGYQPGVIPSTPAAWTSLIHPDDVPGYRAAIERQLSGQTSFTDPEYRVLDAQGEWRWLYSRSKTVTLSEAGAPLRVLGTLQDITARKRADEALRLSQASTRKLSLVASRTDNLVLIASRAGLIEWVNESFERVMEYSLADVVGKPATFLIGPDTSARTVRKIRAAMYRGDGISTDVVNYSKSGKKYHLHLEIQPVYNDTGVLENFIAIQADISARVETEHTLRRAKAEADAASRAKSEFLASMSHEIRTPMNGVIGMTSLLMDTPLSREQRDYVNTIRSSSEALLTIINDILDFSKIESGKMELEHLPFELAVCVEDALDLFTAAAAEKNLELVYHIDASVPAWVQGDVTRLRQVLVNLINNAVKFTPAGSIAIQVKCADGAPASAITAGPVTLEFAVTDTGIGIPSDRLNRLFRPFSQVDSSTTRKYGGTGLGLAICHRLCTLMGGSISVESMVGMGSTFRFTLRSEAVITPPGWGYPELPVRLNYGPTLCVEHHPVTQKRLETFLTTWGARPICAATPAAAVEALRDETPPVAVILDHAMIEGPGGDELRSRICQTEIPTLLLFPAGHPAQELEAFNGRRALTTATKPLRTHALIRGLQNLFDAPADSLPPFSIAPEMQLLAHEMPLDVLVVEDNPVNQKVALRFLGRLGYRADAVGNGLEAVNTLQARHYHLVLMDLQMPEMDGFEATRQIRQRIPVDRQPKIIALTANALHGDREQCLSAGMDDYITKPVKLLDIAHAIRRQFPTGSRSPLRT